MAVNKLSREIEAYEAKLDSLVAAHEGKYVLLHGDKVLGVFDSQMDAVNRGYRELGNVPFLVRHVSRLEVPMSFISNSLAL